jgi:hypothetical protein
VTSTVVDAALCLLLVSASVGTLAAAPGVDLGGTSAGGATTDERRAEAVAATLATTTASVDYTLAPGARHAADGAVAFPTTEGPQFHRSSHGTLAGLVADATVAGLTVDGRRLDHAGDDYRWAVRQQVADAVGSRVQVVADWRPYAGASVTATFTVGPDPPTTASVRASRHAHRAERGVDRGRVARHTGGTRSRGPYRRRRLSPGRDPTRARR